MRKWNNTFLWTAATSIHVRGFLSPCSFLKRRNANELCPILLFVLYSEHNFCLNVQLYFHPLCVTQTSFTSHSSPHEEIYNEESFCHCPAPLSQEFSFPPNTCCCSCNFIYCHTTALMWAHLWLEHGKKFGIALWATYWWNSYKRPEGLFTMLSHGTCERGGLFTVLEMTIYSSSYLILPYQADKCNAGVVFNQQNALKIYSSG